MAWCEENGVDYIFGLARNERLVKAIRRELAHARRESRRTKHAARRFKILAVPRLVSHGSTWMLALGSGREGRWRLALIAGGRSRSRRVVTTQGPAEPLRIGQRFSGRRNSVPSRVASPATCPAASAGAARDPHTFYG